MTELVCRYRQQLEASDLASVYLGAFGELVEVREMTRAESEAATEQFLKDLDELMDAPGYLDTLMV
ncbi:MAG TPA: hypothetical protein VGZ25_10455 [Gemmataceae bacterium]|nr:hypothetical protein [Gemmataceae bacterium]